MKKFLTLLLTVALTATLAITGTIAYLTDTDQEVNVMTLGNVQIEQIELERIEQSDSNTEATNLQDFTPAKALMPAVGTESWSTNYQKWETGGSSQLFADTLKNVQDKFVFVKNTGTSDAYVRTVIACEAGGLTFAEWDKMMHFNVNGTHWTFDGFKEDYSFTDSEGNKYFYALATYEGNAGTSHDEHKNGVIKKGETTRPSLLQVFLDSEATNETCKDIDSNGNGTLDIKVLSQAVQTEGFTNAAEALEVAFPKGVNNANIPTWFGGMEAPTLVGTIEELQAALDADKSVVFTADITGDAIVTQKANANITIDGNGYKFTGLMTAYGNARQTEAETLTIKNIDFVAANGAESCILSPDKTVNGKYSYAHNVTVDNCTFTDPDGVINCAAIRHGDGGDMNWIVKACTVDNTMHSILQVNNVVGKLTIDNCTVNSKNGANLNCCTNVEMTKCNFDVKGYAVRFGVSTGGNLGEAKTFLIKDSTLKSANDDGDAVIMFRASAVDANLTLTNTSLAGTPEFSGNTAETTIIKN